MGLDKGIIFVAHDGVELPISRQFREKNTR